MATTLNQSLKYDIVKQVVSMYYPNEMLSVVRDQLTTFWNEYLDNTIGKIDDPNGEMNIRISIGDLEYLNSGDRETQFTGRYASVPFLTMIDDNYGVLNLNRCPISEIRIACDSIAQILNEREELELFLDSELLKYRSLETFAKHFPELHGVLAPFMNEEPADLPVEVSIDISDIDMNAIAV